MKERPILFSAPMVRAILEGRKTQTRRVVKQPFRRDGAKLDIELLRSMGVGAACPFGQGGDRLWVRETWYCDHCFERDYEMTSIVPVGKVLTREECEKEWRGADDQNMYYRADVPSGKFEDAGYWGEPGTHWRPSIHMPRWASRIMLEITGVRVERLQEISGYDAHQEGCSGPLGEIVNGKAEFGGRGVVEDFRELWNSLADEKTNWDANPWVWVIEFERIEGSRRG